MAYNLKLRTDRKEVVTSTTSLTLDGTLASLAEYPSVFVSRHDCALILGLSIGTIDNMVKAGKLQQVRTSPTKQMILKESLARYIESIKRSL